MKTGLGFGSSVVRFDKAAKSESEPPDCIVESVVSKSLPPTLSLIRSLWWGPGAELEFWSPINGNTVKIDDSEEIGKKKKKNNNNNKRMRIFCGENGCYTLVFSGNHDEIADKDWYNQG